MPLIYFKPITLAPDQVSRHIDHKRGWVCCESSIHSPIVAKRTIFALLVNFSYSKTHTPARMRERLPSWCADYIELET